MFARAESGLISTVHNGYSTATFSRINGSEVLRLLFEAFSQYGKGGRFHHLNTLCDGAPSDWPTPQDCGADLDAHVYDLLPEATRELVMLPTRFHEYAQTMGNFIADEFVVWWCALHRLAAQECFGELAKQMSGAIWVPGKTKPI